MRKTKVICTIGPASGSEETLRRLMVTGMNVARLNFSHGTHQDHKEKIDTICRLRKELGLPVAIMLDTKGPEYRTGVLEGGKAAVCEGDEWIFTADEITGKKGRVSVNYKKLPLELVPGDRILVNNGLLIFEVESVSGNDILTKARNSGELSDRKSMSFPGKVFDRPYLSDADRADLLFGIEQGVDYVACSFVSKRQDIRDVREFLSQNGGENISLIAKIENQSGVDNIGEICEECDGIMIARGDMGVEIDYEKLPAIQKELISKCRMLGKRVITATEMLESMILKPRPTRAEISDVANAVYDGTSAVMLSGETASGKYPVESLETIIKIIYETEQNIHYKKRFYETEFVIKDDMDAISHSACALAIDLQAKAIAVCSISGKTARMVSRFRPPVDIVGICVDESVCRKLALSWGVTPIVAESLPSIEVLFYTAKKMVAEELHLEKGDAVIITGGSLTGKSGMTNTIRIERA